MARKQDVVVVTINHRLNVFGYGHLGAFDARFADSSNTGTLDCVAGAAGGCATTSSGSAATLSA